MNAIEKAGSAAKMLNAAGIKCSIIKFTNGGARVQFTVSQNGKPRTAEFDFDVNGTTTTSKYVYLLPNNLDTQIEKL